MIRELIERIRSYLFARKMARQLDDLHKAIRALKDKP